MARWLMYAGLTLLASAMGYTIFASVQSAGGTFDLSGLPNLLLTLGIVMSIAAAALQDPRRRAIRQWLGIAGCSLVAAYVTYGLSTLATVVLSDPNPGNVFNALGMLGMLLALGGTAAQRSRA
jgi:hypothetical protein